jgi:hypothetical protein
MARSRGELAWPSGRAVRARRSAIYTIVDGLFEIEFSDPGLEAFSFTFG